jgi:hypothetical protein
MIDNVQFKAVYIPSAKNEISDSLKDQLKELAKYVVKQIFV